MNKILLALTATAALALTSNVMADSKKHEHEHHNKPHHGQAKVVNVEPVYRIVRVAYPQEQCWREERRGSNSHRVNYVAPEKLLLGGLIGGVIGHELGRNHNQDAAAVAGAAIGAAVAHTALSQPHRVEYRERPREHCRVETRYRNEKQFDGYRVTYRYHGELFTTRTEEHPGKWIRLDEKRGGDKRRNRH